MNMVYSGGEDDSIKIRLEAAVEKYPNDLRLRDLLRRYSRGELEHMFDEDWEKELPPQKFD